MSIFGYIKNLNRERKRLRNKSKKNLIKQSQQMEIKVLA